MEKEIKEIISLLRKERIIIRKMVESDEKQDRALFNSLKSVYGDLSNTVNIKVNELINNVGYEEVFPKVSKEIDEIISNNKDAQDYITLLGLINSFYLNRLSNEAENIDSDAFSNEFITQIYDIYLWLMSGNEYSKEFSDSIRNDLVMKLVNSRSMRNYFAGNYEEASSIANPLKDEEYNDRNRLGTTYASLMIGQIELSNKFEMYDGIMDEVSFESRKKMLEVEFAAISVILMNRGFLIPPNTMNYSNFTENVIRNASELVEEYKNKKTKEQTKILIRN